jgi:hypothetical protein
MDPKPIDVDDRRGLERRTARYPLDILSGLDMHRVTRAETLNLTSSGLYAVTPDRESVLTLGMRVRLRIGHPAAEGADREALAGTVIRVESLSEDGLELRGVAIKFAEPQPRYA